MPSQVPGRRFLVALAGAALVLLLGAAPAFAQIDIDPTAPAPRDDGGWVYWMAEGAIVVGALAVVFFGAMYLRHAPRFSRDEEAEPRSATRVAEPSVTLQTAWAQPRPLVAPEPVPPPQPAAAPQPVAAGARAGAAPAAGAAGAPAAAAPAGAPAGGAPAAAATPRPAAPPRPKGEPVEQDQDTYDRVLQEELGKGTDRRVAEGRAKSAAVRAARSKAAGG